MCVSVCWWVQERFIQPQVFVGPLFISELGAKTAAVVGFLDVFFLNGDKAEDVEFVCWLFVVKAILSQLFIYSKRSHFISTTVIMRFYKSTHCSLMLSTCVWE